ncbi:MAG: hypothetical protein JWP74_2752 [Marmoricola sp.]|nr:hypothetical protein [Marmoricola sp.]
MSRKTWIVLAVVILLLGFPGLLSSAGAVDPGPPVNQSAPAVTGVARVGTSLTASPGTWAPVASSYAYSWLRDGSAIADAGSSSYHPTVADLHHQLSVRVVATGVSATPSQPALSIPTAAVGLGQLQVTGGPTISGRRRWGSTLTASPASFAPTPDSVRYRWLRDGTPIKGATTRTRALTVADFGTRISIRAVARRTGYATATAVSAATVPIGHRVAVRKTFTYSIATRGRITADVATFARLAAQTYANPRGWRAAGFAFRQVKSGGDFTLVLANASTMAGFGYPCDSTWSCRVGRNVIINQTRWLHASPAWNAAHLALRDYRNMVVDHETGHWLGHHHLTCPGPGRLAPVMMQQSKGLHGCRFNPFPLPSERWTNR